MAPDCIKESKSVFRYAVSKYFYITGFDELGYARIEVPIQFGIHKNLHTIWIEPHLLKKCKVQRKKSATNESDY